MRRMLTTLLTCALVLSLATPAAVAASTDRDEAPAKATAVVATAAPVNVTLNSAQFRASIDRAMTTIKTETVAQQRPGPVMQKPNKKLRHQGGGKTGLIIGLVSTAVGLAATYYMVKMMQQQQEDLQNQQ